MDQLRPTLAPSTAAEQTAYRQDLTDGLAGFLDSKRVALHEVAPEAGTLVDAIADLTQGGKRMRALLAYWGWRGAGGGAAAEQAVRAGVALELFQAAALIHDDIIDRSDTRRGKPSVHRQFEGLHLRQSWSMDAERYGVAAALLTGDLCLSLSEEAFNSVGPEAGSGTEARRIFDQMRTEVMAGQYLDVLEEVAGPSRPAETAVDRALQILRFKSAKYSTVHPLCLGGALAGGGPDLLQAYAQFALPLGEAFQIRDDVLGVFGDPAATGKPAGDDLREGKRTVLIAHTLKTCSEAERRFLDEHLGSSLLADSTIEELRALIVRSGALAAAEQMIEELTAAAYQRLDGLPVDPEVGGALRALADAAVRRTS
ncbi:polyprenyl synthetase family protein [Arthrobacter sp. I2-34]|uniref:Polyprenyl synthetase family protein n=1 Tax=Arthrobacter hankyongi TaxID=2904801 RepID=A0ABS9LB64_9MICC|nr:polyprenyl synthetase family protein [Arthrobacter hankyongi]MCG2623841.1 polyprenyl synthetase family protein [Arthrobacter hankyongi]